MTDLIKCRLCRGVGSFREKNSTKSKLYKFRYCPRCQGLGEVNWIENIFGSTRSLSNDEYHKRRVMAWNRRP